MAGLILKVISDLWDGILETVVQVAVSHQKVSDERNSPACDILTCRTCVLHVGRRRALVGAACISGADVLAAKSATLRTARNSNTMTILYVCARVRGTRDHLRGLFSERHQVPLLCFIILMTRMIKHTEAECLLNGFTLAVARRKPRQPQELQCFPFDETQFHQRERD